MRLSLTILVLTLLISCSSEKEDFDDFFYLFMTDTDFQISRIAFPMEKISLGGPPPYGQLDTLLIESTDWTHDFFYIKEDYIPKLFDNLEGELKDTDERLFRWSGVENGIWIDYQFRRIDGKWFLTKIIDRST